MYDSLTRTPQLLITSGPDAPRPKKERNASVKTEFDTVRTASAQTRGITFGMMCLRTMKLGRAPIARDRSMNLRSLTVRNCERMTRAVLSQITMRIAREVMARLGERMNTGQR